MAASPPARNVTFVTWLSLSLFTVFYITPTSSGMLLGIFLQPRLFYRPLLSAAPFGGHHSDSISSFSVAPTLSILFHYMHQFSSWSSSFPIACQLHAQHVLWQTFKFNLKYYWSVTEVICSSFSGGLISILLKCGSTHYRVSLPVTVMEVEISLRASDGYDWVSVRIRVTSLGSVAGLTWCEKVKTYLIQASRLSVLF